MRRPPLLPALLLAASLLGACNPFEVALPESDSPTHRPEGAMDIPVAETGSAQVSVDAAADSAGRCESRRGHGPDGRH